MIYLGIDWAADKHDLCLLAQDGRILSEFQITHDLEGFERLHQQVSGLGPISVNIERSDGLLVEWLLSHGYCVYITPPSVLAHRRPRRSKDDRGDAYLLAYLLRIGDADARPAMRQSEIVQHLKQLASAYDLVIQQQRKLGNRLIYTLRQYFPAILKVFTVPTSLICLAFLEAYPTPEAARKLTQAQLEAFLRKHHYRDMARLTRMFAALQAPSPTAAVVAGYVESYRVLIPSLRLLHQERARLRTLMTAVFKTHPDAEWWRTIPGASGPLTGPRLLAWIGDDRLRFPEPQVLQAIAGTVPITRRSGKQHLVEFRRACSHPLRKAFDDLAHQSIKRSGWAASYFKDQLARGHSRPRAYRALANRWARIVWKLWQNREPYCEATHVANRMTKGKPTERAA